MKNTKLLFCILVGLLIFSPVYVNALTEEEAIAKVEEKFSKVSTTNEDGTCTWNFKVIDEEQLYKNSCVVTKEQFLEGREWCGEDKCVNVSEEILKENMDDREKYCRNDMFPTLLNQTLGSVGENLWSFSYDSSSYENIYSDGKFKVRFNYEYDVDGSHRYGQLEKVCNVNFVEGNKKAKKQIDDVSRDIKMDYILYSLNTFNSVYHYGPISNAVFKTTEIIYRHPLFKKLIMDNPEFDYEVIWDGFGGTPNLTGCGGKTIISQDDVVYAVKPINYTLDHVLYVDKDEEGTVFEKAEKRLKEYFKDKATVKVKVEEIDQDFVNEFGGVGTTVKINEYENMILIKEVDKKDLDKYEVEAYHKSTGIIVNSNSYEVPSDATLDVEDVTDEVSKKFDKEMYKVHSAYDIEVVKMADGGFVKTIENGIDVYLPISGRTLSEEMAVYHITDNGKGDGYKGIVVEVDGKQYVKFTTTHFSTYAVVEEIKNDSGVGEAIPEEKPDIEEETEENPNTFDGVGYSIIALLVSIITLGGCYIYKKKFN